MTIYIILLPLCLFLSALFSASEMSLSSASRIRLESAAENGSRRAKTALGLLDRFDSALGAILIGNNLVNVASSSLSSVIALEISRRSGAAGGLCTTAATVLVTVTVIIFGETIPKIIAKKTANRSALAVSGFVRGLSVCLRPLVWASVKLTDLLTSAMPKPNTSEDPTEDAVDQLQSLIETAEDEEVLDEDQSELMQAALEFGDITAGEVMTARVDMTAIDIDDSSEEILKIVNDTTYSRLPVYRGDTDNIIGVLHLNSLYRALLSSNDINLEPLLTEPCYVYKAFHLPKVLEEMRARQTHLAIVTDEYGGTAGVISMEDVLESLVGDIWDETDEVDPDVITTPDGSWELDGDLPLDDLWELTGIDPDEDFESETVGGWIMELLDGFAAPGDQLCYKNLDIIVTEGDGRRVESVLVKRRTDEPEE